MNVSRNTFISKLFTYKSIFLRFKLFFEFIEKMFSLFIKSAVSSSLKFAKYSFYSKIY